MRRYLPYIVIAVLIWGLFAITSQRNALREEVRERDSLVEFLNSEVELYKNRYGEEEASKRAAVAHISTLNEHIDQMNEDQKELMRRLNGANRQVDVLTAALANVKVKVDTIVVTEYIEKDGYRFFNYSTDSISFIAQVNGSLRIYDLEALNKMYIQFDENRRGEIFVRASNTNPIFSIQNVEGYYRPRAVKNRKWRELASFLIGVGTGYLIFK